jgi:hypothetical protein
VVVVERFSVVRFSCHFIWSLSLSMYIGVAYASPVSIVSNNYSELCDEVALVAAKKNGIPIEVLMAITRIETGRTVDGHVGPWPWTVNIEGSGVWFKSKAEALDFVFKYFMVGTRSFDVGCFQINYRWHGFKFSSIEDMFDPILNAQYAAALLKSLYVETGSWSKAAGAFHSRTAVHADRYIVRFDAIREELPRSPRTSSQLDDLADESDTKAFEALYPLFAGGRSIGLASLVPLAERNAQFPMIEFTPVSLD